MSSTNPYAPPQSDVDLVPQLPSVERARLNRVASGQRLIIFALAASLLAGALQAVVGALGTLAGLIASIVAIVGAVRLAGALGRSVVARVLYAIAMLLPLINLLGMLALSSQATKALRAAGYKVGFLGAKAR